jgi:hypothetical protein
VASSVLTGHPAAIHSVPEADLRLALKWLILLIKFSYTTLVFLGKYQGKRVSRHVVR